MAISQAEDRLPSEKRGGGEACGLEVMGVGMRSSHFAGMSQFICHVRMMNHNDRRGRPPIRNTDAPEDWASRQQNAIRNRQRSRAVY